MHFFVSISSSFLDSNVKQYFLISLSKYLQCIFTGGKSLCITAKTKRAVEEFLDEKVIVIQPATKNETVVYSVVFYEELRKFQSKIQN